MFLFRTHEGFAEQPLAGTQLLTAKREHHCHGVGADTRQGHTSIGYGGSVQHCSASAHQKDNHGMMALRESCPLVTRGNQVSCHRPPPFSIVPTLLFVCANFSVFVFSIALLLLFSSHQVVNQFTVNTINFLNKFSAVCESKLAKVSQDLSRLEVVLALLETKINSIPWLEANVGPGSAPVRMCWED